MTKIEWVRNEDGTGGMTWNPVRGCTKISPGCKHCYAETFAERWRGVPGHPYEQGFDLRLVPEKLSEPLRRRKPTTYFVNSMSDLFHNGVPVDYIASIWAVMSLAHWHTFQVLTKRAGRMREVLTDRSFYDRVLHHADALRDNLELTKRQREAMYMVGVSDPALHPPGWVWLGVSVEDRKYGLPRIDELRATPAVVRFLSVEPLLEDLGEIDLSGINWVIVGGESGHGARPMQPEWAQSIRNQCVAAGVSFFFKQWGEWCDPYQLPEETARELDAADPVHLAGDLVRVGKKAAGRELDGRTWDEMPRSKP